MPARKRLLVVALATGMMVAPSKAKARTRVATSTVDPPRAPMKQSRRIAMRVPRAQALPTVASPCGRHAVRVERGTVFVDGRAVHGPEGGAYVLASPTWRRDGGALAWIERGGGETRLVVLPDLQPGTQPLTWSLPATADGERVAWAGPQRVVVGPELLAPRAVASWSE